MKPLVRRFGYHVTGHGFRKTHYVWTFSEALAWAACYPTATISRHGHFVARKAFI